MLFAVVSVAERQRTAGDLLGTVRDASGAILPGVTVTVSGPRIAGTQTATTNESGTCRVPNLPPGTYAVRYELSGLEPSARRHRINLGAVFEQNVGLEIGQLAKTVRVTAESPVVDTTSNEVGTTFDQDGLTAALTCRVGFFGLDLHAVQIPGSRLMSHTVASVPSP